MRSWNELVLCTALALAACGNDQAIGDDGPPAADECDTSYLRYNNFGAPFTLDWCRGCHSTAIPMAMRQKAPLDVNFDTIDDIRRWQHQMLVQATGTAPKMPPAGGPSGDERVLLTEWLGCGAP